MSAEDDQGYARLRLLPKDVDRMKIKKSAFLKSYEKTAAVLARNLDRFLDDPDEEVVHDTRTAVRRVDAHVNLLPKSIRTSPEFTEPLGRHLSVMKGTAKIRDLDIVRSEVSRRHDKAAGELLRKIDKTRRSAAEDARDAVALARGLPLPSPNPTKVTQSRLQRRFEKVVARLEGRINALLHLVASDPDRLKELHRLRIDCKKLRYTLELAPNGEPEDVLALTERWQDALGAIRDWDVSISYFGKERRKIAGEFLQTALRAREREFLRFSRSVHGHQGRRANVVLGHSIS